MKAAKRASDFDPRREITHQAAWMLASLAVILLALVLDVRNQHVILPVWGAALPESCWFKRLTGMECPGCGLTRSVVSLVHGNFLDAWHFNPGGYLFFALVAAQMPYRIAQIRRIKLGFAPWSDANTAPAIACLAALLLFVQWACRWWGFMA